MQGLALIFCFTHIHTCGVDISASERPAATARGQAATRALQAERQSGGRAPQPRRGDRRQHARNRQPVAPPAAAAEPLRKTCYFAQYHVTAQNYQFCEAAAPTRAPRGRRGLEKLPAGGRAGARASFRCCGGGAGRVERRLDIIETIVHLVSYIHHARTGRAEVVTTQARRKRSARRIKNRRRTRNATFGLVGQLAVL